MTFDLRLFSDERGVKLPRIAFSTLGCKINQYDTAAIQSSVTDGNDYTIVPFDGEADIYVVNTCTVTGKSDAESRRIIRRALRKNRNARVVVTGCYAQTNPGEIARIPGVTMILGNDEKYTLRDYLKYSSEEIHDRKIFVGDISKTPVIHSPELTGFPLRTRAILKIQDGCDSRCSYCIVPFARGAGRSLSPDNVINQIMSLYRSGGYKEIVLSGVHLGGYGRDLSPKVSLSSLIKRILSETDIPRVRLSSIEPREVTDELIKLMSSEERVCRHLHIPLQSGYDYILRQMNRNYTAAFYEGLVLKIKGEMEDVGIGCDVMVGYPGEEEWHFDNTYRFIERLPLTYLHVFAYSPRPGTAAFNLKDSVRGDIKDRRSEMLRGLGEKKNFYFKNAHAGKVVDVLVEEERDEVTGLLKGYTGNYLRVLVLIRMNKGFSGETDSSLINSIVSIHITGIMNGSLSGELPR